MTSSWATTDPTPNPMKPSLVERAMKRECKEGASQDVYVVFGNDSLGDKYPQYLVRFGDRYENGVTCDCLSPNRTGGQYRRTCSHITRAMIYREEHGPWGGFGEEDEETSADLPPTDDEDLPDPARKAEVEEPEGEGGENASVRGSAGEAPSPSSEGNAEEEGDEADDTKEQQDLTPPSSPNDSLPTLSNGMWDTDNDDLWDLLYEGDILPLPTEVKVNPLDPPLPNKFQQYRGSDQWNAVLEVDAALDQGYKAVFVSAPTGSGKTLIAESIRRLRGIRAIYTCTTKTLQDQILKDFDYARVLKGRSNYPTYDKPGEYPNLNALDCTKAKKSMPACENCPGWQGGDSWKVDGPGGDPLSENPEQYHCNWCHPVGNCPYESAKMAAAQARLAILNTAYFLAETNFVGNSLFKGRSLVLIDEADLLEEELMRFIEVSITAKDRKMLGVGLPEKKTVDESWVIWITEELLPAIKAKLKEVDLSPDLFGNPDVGEVRRKNKLTRLAQKANRLVQEEEDEETGEKIFTLNKDWVYTGYEKDWRTGKYPPDNKVNVTFKPVHVREYAPSFLWNKGQQFVLLSATLISPAQMAWDLGLEDDEWTVVEVPSSFPVLQRPIVPRGVANVINKQMDTAIPALIDECLEIMEEHPDERILVHSVSYRLTKELFQALQGDRRHGKRVGAYFNANEREGALRRYLNIKNGVLIAPSFDRGVDLPADDCRVVVVAKIPYMSVGDKQVKARLYGTGKAGKVWYAVQAIRTLCQMTGRGMRSEEDYCRTYVLDKQFTELYNRNRKLFPKWWADAIVWDENDPKWRGMA